LSRFIGQRKASHQGWKFHITLRFIKYQQSWKSKDLDFSSIQPIETNRRTFIFARLGERPNFGSILSGRRISAALGRVRCGEWLKSLRKTKQIFWSDGMNSSTAKYLIEKLESAAKAVDVRFTEHNLMVDLEDGRTISVPLAYYPRLYHGSSAERQNWLIEGEGIHWPDLDEDIRTADLLIGLHSAESQESLRHWLEGRKVKAGLL
jgi:hypothetical protein